jgi:hypothetical protein
MENKPSLATQGYELVSHSTKLAPEELLAGNTPEGRKLIEEKYYAECKAIIEEMTGSKIVRPYIFRIRQMATNPAEFGTKSVTNAGMTAKSLPIAHVDRDRDTLADGIREAIGDEAEELMQRHKRYAQINVWRGIDDRVQRWPLVMINHAQVEGWDYGTHMETVVPINDPRVAIRGHKSQDCVLRDDPGYQYHYASDMTRDEVLVFSSGDSDERMVVPHGAFWDDSTAEDAPSTRRSIEVRSWVFFGDDE